MRRPAPLRPRHSPGGASPPCARDAPVTRAALGEDVDAASALAQQRTRIFSLRPLRTTAVLWCEADALQAAGAAAGAGTVAATFGPSAPAHAHQKLGDHHTQAPTRSTGTVSSKLKVDVQDVARLCSRKSHVKVGRRLRAARRLQLGWVGAFAGREGYLWHVAPPRLPPTPAPAESSRSEGGDIHRPNIASATIRQ